MNDKRAYTEYTVTTATTDFVIGFDDYDDITKDTIVVTVNGVLAESQGYAVMRKNAQVITITPAVPSGTVRLERVTDIDESFHQFTAGALFSAKSVDENFEQVRHSQQEVRDGFEFLEFNTNGVISDAKAATDRANAAAEFAENIDVAQLQVDLEAQKLDTGIISTSKNGTLPIDQAVKNAQTISLVEYGAVGDGVTDDTAAFELLEVNVTGRTIDLQGKTYKVDSLPYANDYINGNFTIESNIIKSRGDFSLASDTSGTPFNLNTAGRQASLRSIMTRLGIGKNNVVQSIAVDEVNRYMYSLSASTPYLLCRYNYDNSVYNTAIDYNEDAVGDVLGHQGIGVEQLGNGETLLWGSSGNDNYTGSKVHTFQYRPSADGLLIKSEVWILYPQDGVKQSLTPAISVDQKYLVVARQVNENKGLLVRVFDMQTIKKARSEGRFDITNEFLTEFDYLDIDAVPTVSRQAMACDGHNIYVLWATHSIELPDFLLQFDMRGNFIRKYDSHHIGLSDSQAVGAEGLHEPEGLCFVNSPKGGVSLLYQVAHDDAGKRKCYVYEVGGEQAIQSFTRDTPALLAQSMNSLTLAAPTGESIKVGTYSKTAGNLLHFDIDPTGRLLKGVTRSVAIDGITTGFQWHSADTQSNAVFGRWGSGASSYPQVMLFRSNSNTIGVSDAVTSGKTLGMLSYYSDVGTGSTSATGKLSAALRAVTTGNVIAGASPTRLEVSTTDATGDYKARWYFESAGHLLPVYNNSYDVGSASNVVKSIYLQNSPIVSSDERLKQDFRNLKAAEKKAALEIKESICLYKMRDSVEEKGDGARWHVGVKAQQIVSIMESHKLKPFDYGFVCHDTWESQDAVLDEDGNEVQAEREAGDKYAVRYDELAMFILAAI